MNKINYQEQLDNEQFGAVTADINKPCLVLAGAGSGKTRVLQNRAFYLIENGIPPEDIIVTTFTTKAASEIKDRIAQKLGKEETDKMTCGTIHSICYRMLMESGLRANVMEDRDKKKIIEDVMKLNKIEYAWKYPLYWINRCKADMISWRESEDFLYNKFKNVINLDEFMSKRLAMQMSIIYKSYETEKINNGMIDFADMICLTAKKLIEEDDWREAHQNKVVLIDEAQDNMKLAVDILETLAAPSNRIFMVGDDLQTLYAWNFANVDNNIFGFINRYPNANLYKIQTNYRSSKRIVELSNRLVDNQYGEDKKKFKKFLSPMSTAIEGTNVNVVECKNTVAEAEVVGDWVNEMIVHEGKKAEEIYVLYRMNAQSRPIEDALIQRQIPYVILGSLGFYDRAVVKDILSFMVLIKDKSENANNAFKRISNIASVENDKYYRGFGMKFFEECGVADASLWEGMKKVRQSTAWFKRKGIDDFIKVMDTLEKKGNNNPKQTIRLIRELAYDNWLSNREGISDSGDSGVFDDANELEDISGRFETIEEMLNYIIRVRKAKEAQKAKGESGVVTLATVHKVKGLERKCVALIGMSNGILPHWKALASGAGGKDDLPVDINTKVEDERCICFVGVTRAREELLLTYPLEFRGKKMERSMFLGEMKL